MTTTSQFKLFQAVQTHATELETIRVVASGPDLEALNRRIEAAQLLLEWLSQALEPRSQASPAAQTRPPSRFPADQDQSPPYAPDSPSLLAGHSQVTVRRPKSRPSAQGNSPARAERNR